MLCLRRVRTHQDSPDVFAKYIYMKVKTIFKNFLIILIIIKREREGERETDIQCKNDELRGSRKANDGVNNIICTVPYTLPRNSDSRLLGLISQVVVI